MRSNPLEVHSTVVAPVGAVVTGPVKRTLVCGLNLCLLFFPEARRPKVKRVHRHQAQ